MTVSAKVHRHSIAFLWSQLPLILVNKTQIYSNIIKTQISKYTLYIPFIPRTLRLKTFVKII